MIYCLDMKNEFRRYQTDLRFGCIAPFYHEVMNEKTPGQMDLLALWFPGLIITEEESKEKKPAEYSDNERRIHAMKYNDRFYSGGSTRVSQILGRLCGTAQGNQEKEREAAHEIRMRIAEEMVSDMTLMPALQENAQKLLGRMDETQQSMLYDKAMDEVYLLIEQRKALSENRWLDEPFAMSPESFDGIVYNCAYQLKQNGFEGLCNAWLWLLIGGLLRNESGRVLRVYRSNFIAVNRQPSQDNTLEDKINCLFHPEQYYDVYDGDDLDHRFPGVEWYCDSCQAHLNIQPGFDDHLEEWKCTECGHVNTLRMDRIYDTEEDLANNAKPSDAEKFRKALIATVKVDTNPRKN